MLITDRAALARFASPNRIWQGIPSIEVTKRGRIFLTFYSGGTQEQIGNYSMLIVSDDGGETFSEPVAAAYLEAHRCYDPCLWIDPLGRLWFTWAIAPSHAVCAAICDDPDSETLVWHEVRRIGHDVMMNKPTVLTTGEWLFPIAVWREGLGDSIGAGNAGAKKRGAFAVKSSDNGETFTMLGAADVPNRSFDEHMILELRDGRLQMFVRTNYGIGTSYSYDRGVNWGPASDSGLGGPSSRFFIRRLRSGRVLLINHVNYTGRNNLTALLSEDDGLSWKYSLLLDSRSNIAYPDAKEADDGYIYITYDRERGGFKRRLEDALASAREILIARITESDIMAGEVRDSGSWLARVASRLGEYCGAEKNPYGDPRMYTDAEVLTMLLERGGRQDMITCLMNIYPPNCERLGDPAVRELDAKIAAFCAAEDTDENLLLEIIALSRRTQMEPPAENPIVERLRRMLAEDTDGTLSITAMAEGLHISRYYMAHLFKRVTGITCTEYRNAHRLTRAKRMLIGSDATVAEIAAECGFASPSYFAQLFARAEGITPVEYRRLHKK